MSFTREDIQHVSDLRLIALALIKRWDGADSRAAAARRMRQICDLSEEIIANGPPEFRFIIERTASLASVQHEQRRSVFGSDRSPL
jgi:hypothetical protein